MVFSNAPPILARYGLINPGDCSGPALFVRARRPSADHGLENLGEGRPIALGLTQIVGMLKIQGKGAKKRFLDFLTVNIRNPNTRAAYGALPPRFCIGAMRVESARSMRSSRSTSQRTSSNSASG